eukprot:gene33232-37547_t
MALRLDNGDTQLGGQELEVSHRVARRGAGERARALSARLFFPVLAARSGNSPMPPPRLRWDSVAWGGSRPSRADPEAQAACTGRLNTGETSMQLKHTLAAMAFGLTAVGAMAQTVVGVSWSNFQEERWKTDEAAIKAQLEKQGAKYISADAGGSPEKQLGDIEGLMAKGAKALIVLAMDKDAILPAVTKATRQKVPVVAYDRLIEAPGVFYITFDNVEVGRMEAREVLKVKPKGNYVIIKGSPADPNADFLRAGQQEVLAESIKKGDIKIVGDEYTEGWKPEVAQKNMEQILTKNGNKVDAVVAANDGTAGGAVAALTAKG